MQSSVDHHNSSSRNNQIDGTFGHSIFPFGSNTTESQGLVTVNELLSKSIASIDAIVCVVTFHLNAKFSGQGLKKNLEVDGICCIQSYLMFNVNVT